MTKLQEYLKTHPATYYEPVDSILDLLYNFYTETNPAAPKETAAGRAAKQMENELEVWLKGIEGMDRMVEDYGLHIPLWEDIMDHVGSMCCAWERTAFEEGVKTGIRLMMEVGTLFDNDFKDANETELCLYLMVCFPYLDGKAAHKLLKTLTSNASKHGKHILSRNQEDNYYRRCGHGHAAKKTGGFITNTIENQSHETLGSETLLTGCLFFYIATVGASNMIPRLKNIEVETYHYAPQKTTAAGGNNILRVAAYARVSTLSEDQGESFETQCAYYEKLIASNPKMILVGVYGDQGVSGLSTKGRTEFSRMMQDCKDGKIDYVITRSVSRLSRNMAECVETVNILKDLGIPVRFEKEGLTSTDPGSEMFFHVLATLAQEESGSTSRRITWALEKRAEMGDPARKCPYGYRKPTGEEKAEDGDCRAWVFDESEAKRVRKAFEMATDIYPYDAILGQLDQIEMAEGTDVRLTHERLYHMLRNEVYRGDVLTHKTYGVDYVTRKRAVNRGERTKYYVHDHHEPMIPIEMYERVQSLMDAGLLHSAAYKLRENHERKALRWRYEEAERMAVKAAKERREEEKQKNIVQVEPLRG